MIGALEQSLPIINCQFHLMLSAFVSIPAVKMDWIAFGMKTVAVVSTKMAANALVPGLGAAFEFAQAAYDYKHGDKVGALISTVSGVADIVTLGLSGSIQGAMKEGAKKSTEQGAKEMAKKAGKEATKKYGREVGRQLAQGTFRGGKEAAVKHAPAMADEALKKAMKLVDELLRKEIAQGLISESAEEVLKEGTKKSILHDLILKGISTGGNDVLKGISKGYIGDATKKAISEATKQNKKLLFEFAKIAEEGALKELMNHSWKFTVQDWFFASAKGVINYSTKM